jgi:hypothetical protein
MSEKVYNIANAVGFTANDWCNALLIIVAIDMEHSASMSGKNLPSVVTTLQSRGCAKGWGARSANEDGEVVAATETIQGMPAEIRAIVREGFVLAISVLIALDEDGTEQAIESLTGFAELIPGATSRRTYDCALGKEGFSDKLREMLSRERASCRND